MPHLRLAVRKKASLLVSRPTPPPLLAPPPLAEGTLLIAYETMLGVLFKKVVKHLERERERKRSCMKPQSTKFWDEKGNLRWDEGFVVIAQEEFVFFFFCNLSFRFWFYERSRKGMEVFHRVGKFAPSSTKLSRDLILEFDEYSCVSSGV